MPLGVAADTDEDLLAGMPLTSCWGAQFLRGHRPVHNPGVGDPWNRLLKKKVIEMGTGSQRKRH